MNNISELKKQECTGCGACSVRCPKKCIKMVSDEKDNIYPEVDQSRCIHCGVCKNICHICNKLDRKANEIQKAYAVWNCDDKIRRMSASGGAISAFYQYASESGFYYVRS